jgi:hypothetical protein
MWFTDISSVHCNSCSSTAIKIRASSQAVSYNSFDQLRSLNSSELEHTAWIQDVMISNHIIG